MHPPKPRRTAVVVLSAMLGLLAVIAGPAVAADVPWTVEGAANDFGAGRQSLGYTVNPGAAVSDGIVVVNHGSTPLHLTLHPADAHTSRAGKLDLVAADAESKGLGAWLRPEHDDLTVGPGDSLEVPFVITLPKDAAAGDYVGGILTQAGGAGQRVPIQVSLRVGGALKPSLAVEGVDIDYSGTASPFGKGDATLSYTIRNTGNATLAARQKASASGPFGRWDVTAEKVADSPALLPGETWKVSVPLHGVTPALRLTANVTVFPLLTDAAGSTSPLAGIKASGHAWTIPWALLLALVVVCALVVAGVKLRPRRRAPSVTA